MSTFLWDQVADCFRHDDGSLPSIRITKLSPHGVSAIYAMLRARSRLTEDEPSKFWSRTLEADISIDSVPDAAALVAAGQAEAFHFCITGFRVAEVELPVLGVFVWPDCIEFDYRMGPIWGSVQVSGFFEMLKDCCSLDPAAIVIPAEFDGPPKPERFVQAWAAYQSQKSH